MIFCGFFFGKVKIINKEGLIAFAKMNIEIFLPVYLFIAVCRCNFTLIYDKYGGIIISNLLFTIFSFIICYLYTLFTKMDLRYRFTFIIITSFIDIKRLYFLYINSFCFLYEDKENEDSKFCNNILQNSQIQIFYQGILIWFLAYNLIKMDKEYENECENLYKKIKEDEVKKHNNNNNQLEIIEENSERMTLNNEQKNELKNIFNEYKIEEEGSDDIKHIPINANEEFFKKITKYQKIKFFKSDNLFKEIIKIFIRSPLIALFVGFIVGFIRVLREWIYDTTTPVYLFFDTFNTIGNCNIFVGFLMIGGNLILNKEKKSLKIKYRLIDYISHCIIKCLILPFLGIIFCYVCKKKYYEDKNVLNWTCFLQWLLPTSIDIIAIVQLKDINGEFAAICMSLQMVLQMIFNNFVHVSTFLKTVDLL
jgi:predicted permease